MTDYGEGKYLPVKYEKELDAIMAEYFAMPGDVDFDEMDKFIRERASDKLLQLLDEDEKAKKEDEARAREEAEPGERFIIG